MLAIYTRYLGPTNYRSGRISGTIYRDGSRYVSATVEYSHELGQTENHKAAAMACLEKYNARLEKEDFPRWQSGCILEVSGDSPDGKGHVFLMSDLSGWRFIKSQISKATSSGKLVDIS